VGLPLLLLRGFIFFGHVLHIVLIVVVGINAHHDMFDFFKIENTCIILIKFKDLDFRMMTGDNPPAVCNDNYDLRKRINTGIIVGLFLAGMGILILAVKDDALALGIVCVSMGVSILLATFIILCKELYLARRG